MAPIWQQLSQGVYKQYPELHDGFSRLAVEQIKIEVYTGHIALARGAEQGWDQVDRTVYHTPLLSSAGLVANFVEILISQCTLLQERLSYAPLRLRFRQPW